MKKITLLFATLICAFTANAQLIYAFDSVKTTSGTIDPTPLPVVTGVTLGSFTAVGTPPNSLAAARFDFADWASGSVGGVADTLFSGMTGTINTAEYYQVTISPASGYSITGDSIKFTFERSGTGVRTYAVRSSLDGFTSNLNAVYGLPTTNVAVQTGNIFFLKKDITTVQTRNIIVLGPSFMNLTSALTFRFYAWNSEAPTGTFSIDNVNFIGSSTSLTTGVSEKNKTAVNVYPNPSVTGTFTADLTAFSGKTNITVYDIVGNVVFTKEATSGAKQLIDLSNQANGSYFVTVKNENESMTKKIMIAK
ncbi:hypothetical protein BH10BAC1_BH10BAC1_02170 [soil metagenome]